MGTRSITKFSESPKDKPFVAIYRQFDGYPSGMGKDLRDLVGNFTIKNGFNGDDSKCLACGKDRYEHDKNLACEFKPKPVANGMGCLAAFAVKGLKDSIGNVYLTSPEDQDAWQEYEYHLSANRYFPDTRPTYEQNRQAMCDENATRRILCEAALREFGEELAKIVDEHTRGSLELAKIADDAGAKQDAAQHRMDSHISKSCAAAIRAAIRESL